ncbi:uncharacterized protein LOC128309796 [Anopheles moucheti]|uniref:uncharacterized protein LOC128309796 n=1 Tax=Anopheles moucheti TaxID=186751 RepID=UPI0022F13EB9|nr:uncharacterized protein LOC128309796 [Anopheles moucheti]
MSTHHSSAGFMISTFGLYHGSLEQNEDSFIYLPLADSPGGLLQKHTQQTTAKIRQVDYCKNIHDKQQLRFAALKIRKMLHKEYYKRYHLNATTPKTCVSFNGFRLHPR